jgi:hypothetical protein
VEKVGISKILVNHRDRSSSCITGNRKAQPQWLKRLPYPFLFGKLMDGVDPIAIRRQTALTSTEISAAMRLW